MLNPLYTIVTWIVLAIHAGLSPVFGKDSGLTWGLSIVLLTVVVRLLLFPLFVKQIKTQRAMQELQPKIKELQARHKGDRETLNTELMKLYREHGANPLSGCLPLIAQMPVFFALFHVLNTIAKDKAEYGLTPELAQSAASAKIFGAPIASSFTGAAEAARFGASPGTVRVVSVVLIVLMGLTTFITQKQLMARSAASNVDNPMAAQQKILLYVLPLSFAVFGVNFPIGVLIYWLTTNLWSMGQQFIVLRRLNPVPAVAGVGNGGAGAGGDTGRTRENARALTPPAPRRVPKRSVPGGGQEDAADDGPAGTAANLVARLPWLRPRRERGGAGAGERGDGGGAPPAGRDVRPARASGEAAPAPGANAGGEGGAGAATGGSSGQRQQPVSRSRSARRGGKGGKSKRR
ncbi:MAG TPA: membrane protein insertase YidC [Mycobacteriales bacterium]|nr:membrane protein insertase YidC [Mycobacteriales bacterium]